MRGEVARGVPGLEASRVPQVVERMRERVREREREEREPFWLKAQVRSATAVTMI